MSSTTWNGSSSTDWATGANWSTGSPPTTGAHVVIPDTSSINNCVLDQTRTIGSLTVQTNGTLVGGGFTLNITGEGDASGGTEGYAAEIDGHISGELNLISTKDGTTYLDLVCQSGNIHDLTINSSGGDYKILVGNTTLTGTLWIKDGNLKMNGDSDTLSVTEGIKLGNGSDAGFFGHNDHDGAITTGYLQLGTSGSTFISTEGTLTLTQDSTNALIYESISGSTFTNNDGTVLITGDGRVKQRAGTGNFHNVTLNASGNTIEQEADTTLDNTLTITAGEWHTGYDGYGYSNLTVGGHIFGNGTFKAFTSTVTVAGQVGVANVELTSGSITSNDDFRPTTKTTITGNGSITATGGSQMGGLFDIGASNTPTLQAGRLHSTLDIPSGNQGQSTFNLALNEDQTGPSRHLFFYNLTLDSEGTENNTLTMAGAITFTGNLTITDGIIDTSGSNHALTVGTGVDGGDGSNGHLLILDAGELVCNSSTVIVGSVYCQIAAGSNGTGFSELNLPDALGSFTVRGPEKSGYVFRLDNQAECNHNSGTVTFAITAESGSTVMDVKSLRGTQLNNILVTQSESGTGSASSLQFVGGDVVKGNLTLTGNGTNTCNVDTNYAAAPLTVDGDVTVNSDAILGVRNTNTGTFTFGSLTINSGGIYRATSGTTTIAGQTGTNNLCFTNGGTFTHNGGTLNITGNTWGTSQYAHIYVGSNQDFGNVTINAGADSKYYQFRAGSTTFYFNNFYAKYGEIRDYNNNNTFHIRGNLDIGTRGAGGTGAVWLGSDARDNDNTIKTFVDGTVTVWGAGQFHVPYGTDGTDGCKVGGIRNVAGTVYAVEQE